RRPPRRRAHLRAGDRSRPGLRGGPGALPVPRDRLRRGARPVGEPRALAAGGLRPARGGHRLAAAPALREAGELLPARARRLPLSARLPGALVAARAARGALARRLRLARDRRGAPAALPQRTRPALALAREARVSAPGFVFAVCGGAEHLDRL